MNFVVRLKEQLSRRRPAQRRLLFVFGGASHNWRGPGQELYSTQPVFRAAIDAAESAVRASLGFSVGAMFRGEWSPSSEEEQRRSDIISMGLLHIGLLEAFVDEVIRLYPPEMMVPRTTIAPVRLGGVKIAAGQHIMLSLAAANRDPARFEEPAAIRLDRPLGRHLSFGAGIHKCSGTAMSGPIIRAALRALLDTAPQLEPAEPLHELSYYNTMAYHRPRRLLVAQ